MDVIRQGAVSPAAPDAQPDDGATFLAEQAECLAAGLANADDPLTVRAVLRTHDGGHDRWLTLIAAAGARDPVIRERLAALYTLHGRVAGSLERGMRGLPDADLHSHLGTLLAQRLRAATDEAIAALRRG